MPISDDPEPRWDIVTEFYTVLDDNITKMYKSDKITYGEIEIAMMMMNDKILQQKVTLMHEYLKSEKDEELKAEEKPEPENIYK
jgi:hypothetical protein|tara:strand:- start:1335 stop:1586 length:252 start_codon:yes stop_codon:yes gene_type:complete